MQDLAGKVASVIYLVAGAEPEDDHGGWHRFNRTFDSFSESECWTLFRFKKQDLSRLLTALAIPEFVITETSKFSGEEVLLSSLYRLGNKTLNDVAILFGREYSQWGKAWRWFIAHIWEHYRAHMMNNLPYWQPIFER